MKHPIISIFKDAANPNIAKKQGAYMKERHPYFGIKTPYRRDL